jgi:predicted nucleic acid-binding protein
MKDYVLDANAVLRYFKVSDAQGGELVRDLALQVERKQARLFISVINVGEVYYTVLRQMGEQRASHAIQGLRHVATIIEADLSLTIEAAALKHHYKLGYADSFAAALALSYKATLVSADPDFEKIGKQLKWLKLPKFTGKTR